MGYQRAFILHFHRFVYSRKRTNQVTFFKKLFLSFTGWWNENHAMIFMGVRTFMRINTSIAHVHFLSLISVKFIIVHGAKRKSNSTQPLSEFNQIIYYILSHKHKKYYPFIISLDWRLLEKHATIFYRSHHFQSYIYNQQCLHIIHVSNCIYFIN